MDLLLGFLLEFLGDVLIGGLVEGLWELLRPTGRAIAADLLPGGSSSRLHRWLACFGASLAGAALGVASAHLLPERLIAAGPAAAATWLAVPLGAGLAALGFDRLRDEDRRAPSQAVLSGVLIGLAYLALRVVARPAGA